MTGWCAANDNKPEPDTTNDSRAARPPSVPTPEERRKAPRTGLRQNDGATTRQRSKVIRRAHQEVRCSIRAGKMPGTKPEDSQRRSPENPGPYRLREL